MPLQGGRPVVVIELGVPAPPNPEQAEIDQPDRGRGHALTVEVVPAEMATTADRSPGSALANRNMCTNFWASRCSRHTW